MTRPELKALKFVDEVRQDHIPHLVKIAQLRWDGISPQDLLIARNKDQMNFFELKSGKALVITETHDQPSGRELFLVGVAGLDILVSADDLISDLKVIAREFDCRFIGGLGIPGGWERPAKSHGFRKAATYYLLDLELN